ncbi:MAG: hypothetical protein ACFFDM_06050 [Candidatus Thorarchaeota archaeon]
MSALDRGTAQAATRHTSFAGSGHFWSMSRMDKRYGTGMHRFSVPVCERHAISFEETARLRGPCGICSGLLIVLALFLGMFLLGSFALTGVLDLMTILLIALVIIGIMITSYVGGPSELEKAIKVLDSSEGAGMMVLQIRNREYAEELLRLNPSSAKSIVSS